MSISTISSIGACGSFKGPVVSYLKLAPEDIYGGLYFVQLEDYYCINTNRGSVVYRKSDGAFIRVLSAVSVPFALPNNRIIVHHSNNLNLSLFSADKDMFLTPQIIPTGMSEKLWGFNYFDKTKNLLAMSSGLGNVGGIVFDTTTMTKIKTDNAMFGGDIHDAHISYCSFHSGGFKFKGRSYFSGYRTNPGGRIPSVDTDFVFTTIRPTAFTTYTRSSVKLIPTTSTKNYLFFYGINGAGTAETIITIPILYNGVNFTLSVNFPSWINYKGIGYYNELLDQTLYLKETGELVLFDTNFNITKVLANITMPCNCKSMYDFGDNKYGISIDNSVVLIDLANL